MNSTLGNSEFRKYKYLCSHYADEDDDDDIDPHYYYDNYDNYSPVLPNAGRKNSK